jgi:hypothetical protein
VAYGHAASLPTAFSFCQLLSFSWLGVWADSWLGTTGVCSKLHSAFGLARIDLVNNCVDKIPANRMPIEAVPVETGWNVAGHGWYVVAFPLSSWGSTLLWHDQKISDNLGTIRFPPFTLRDRLQCRNSILTFCIDDVSGR